MKIFNVARASVVGVLVGFIIAITIASTIAVAATIVKYRPSLGAASPALDIYSFKGANNAPVVIYVHGGGWQFGSRTRVALKPAYFNNAGYLFVSVDYRLVPRVKVEDQLVDIDRAIGWIYDNIGNYGGNKNNLHLMGHSAGAHLVSMTGVKPGKRAAKLIGNGALRSIIANDTLAYDIPLLAARRGGRLHRVYNRPFGFKKDRWRRLSPQNWLSGGPKPAFLIMYSGQGNPGARRKIGQRFAEQLGKSGARVTLFDGRKYTHRQINVSIGADNAITVAIDRFLKQYSR